MKLTDLKIPAQALAQHTAIVGKTGSGKTSTEKLAVEQVVAEDYRVCILDAIKSDWWGITSSSDGKKPGLPFKILGGPHGHVPIHSSAGAVIGQLVGSGKLPLSIIDMADFEAGGLQRFFVDFAPALMRSMKGVLYLVIEEAHEFAPKERSGFGAENMAIHWAKKLATAGRSKGIRMIVATQRVQSLHNAVLGSCETLIAHRLTTPADQEPVLKWLKGNTDKETTDEVSRSLSSLPTGTGWLCSGEARIFKQVAFPKFKTYDNAATPEKDGTEKEVKTAAVNPDELRLIIGDAVKEAESNDPKRLRKKIAELEGKIKSVGFGDSLYKKKDDEELRLKEFEGYRKGKIEGYAEALKTFEPFAHRLDKMVNDIRPLLETAENVATGIRTWAQRAPATDIGDGIALTSMAHPAVKKTKRVDILRTAVVTKEMVRGGGTMRELKTLSDKVLATLASYPGGRSKHQIALMCGVSHSGGYFNNTLGKMRSEGLIEGTSHCKITPAGHEKIGPVDPLPVGDDLVRFWINDLGGLSARILAALHRAYPAELPKESVASVVEAASDGGYFNNTLGKLRSLGLVTGTKTVRLSDELMEAA